MRYRIPGTEDIWITDDHEFVKFSGEKLHLPKHGDKIKLKMYDVEVEKTVEWLYLAARLRAVTRDDIENLEFVKIEVSNAAFPWRVVYKEPKLYFDDPNFRIVPNWPSVAIDENGNPINALTGEPLCVKKDYLGYLYTLAYDFIMNRVMPVSIHRLVALAWVNNPDPAHLNTVNHLDGVNENCHRSNFEWTTPKGNRDHAVNNGLDATAKKCRLHNIKTDEILEFPSLEQANAFLGMRPKEIVNFKQRRANIVYNGKYEVRMEGDDRPWSYTKNTVNVEPSRYIFHITDNGETLTYNGTRSVIKKYKLWNLPSNSAKQVLQVLKEQYPDIKVECIDQYETRPIQVRNIETGEVREFRKVKDAVNEMGFCKTMLLYGMKYDGRKVISDKYVVRRKTSNPWPKDLMEVKNKPMGVKITDKSTKESHVYKSLKEAARKTILKRGCIMRMLFNPRPGDKYEVVKCAPLSGDR